MATILVAGPDPAISDSLSSLLRRFGDVVIWTQETRTAVEQLDSGQADLLLLDERLGRGDVLTPFERVLRAKHPPIILLQDAPDLKGLIQVYQRGVAYSAIKPFHTRELVSCIHALIRGQRRIVCLGGGTGLYVLLLGLKTLPDVHLTSIVNMSDDGGSSGRIREVFGVLPPGDVRRSLVALSSAPALMNELIQYRFPEGEGLKDHNLGNLLLTAMAKLRGSMAEAIRSMADILDVQGIVVPVTTTANTLMAELADGTIIRGEQHIDVPGQRDPAIRIARLWQEPEPEANPNALSAILAADVITIGPGDLFTSIVATLAVRGIHEAVQAARGRTMYLCNLMTKPGETSGFNAADHVREIVRYLGEDVLDDMVVSNTVFSKDALAQYAKKGQEQVLGAGGGDLQAATKANIRVCDVGSEDELVRHDSRKLASEIATLLGISTGSPTPESISPSVPSPRSSR